MKEGILNMTSMRILLALLILMLMIALGSYANLNYEKISYLDDTPAVITVSGVGEVVAKPDIGRFTFAVQAEASEAAVAQELSGTKINDILAFLKGQGIEDKDVKVQFYNLSPRYRWEERVCPSNTYCPPGDRVADGFVVDQSVQVSVRDIDAAPAIIAGVGERGATNISQLSFTIDDADALKAEARALAIRDAQEKMMLLAQQLGVRLVRLASYTEGDGGYQPLYREMAMMADSAEEKGFGGAELPVGEESTTVTVQLQYEVK